MKLAAIPQPDTRTTAKLFLIIMVQAFIPVLVYRFVFQSEVMPSTPAYTMALMGMTYATYRINSMPYWQNILMTVLLTFASVCIGAAGSIYL